MEVFAEHVRGTDGHLNTDDDIVSTGSESERSMGSAATVPSRKELVNDDNSEPVAAVSEVIKNLSSRSADVRLPAIETLRRLYPTDVPAAIERLVQSLKNKDAGARRKAARDLWWIARYAP